MMSFSQYKELQNNGNSFEILMNLNKCQQERPLHADSSKLKWSPELFRNFLTDFIELSGLNQFGW